MKTSLILTALSFSLCSTAVMAYEQDKTYQFTILHTNDLHGHFWQNDKGEFGLAAQKTLVDRIKKEVEAKGAQ